MATTNTQFVSADAGCAAAADCAGQAEPGLRLRGEQRPGEGAGIHHAAAGGEGPARADGAGDRFADRDPGQPGRAAQGDRRQPAEPAAVAAGACPRCRCPAGAGRSRWGSGRHQRHHARQGGAAGQAQGRAPDAGDPGEGRALGQKAIIDTRNGLVAGHVTRIDPSAPGGTVTVDVALDGAAAERRACPT